MEVTRKNFNEIYNSLPEVFKKAQFLTFDTEFTGLRVEGATGNNYFDLLDDLYLKDRLKAETFMAIQFGIVAFFYHETTKKYTHQGYNFYIYPSSYSDINFTCQSKSIEFLVQNGFDFNKVFKDGIPYLRDTEIEKLLEKLKEKHCKINQNETLNHTKLEIPADHAVTISQLLNKIEHIKELNSKTKFITEKYNSYVRKLIYNAVFSKFSNSIYMETNKDETITILVGYSGEEIKKIQEENYMKDENKILGEYGFTKVIKLIIESKKLLVGHNLFIDILFTIRQFLTPLPNKYCEFKKLVNFLFPKILDTKYLVSVTDLKNLKDTSLFNVTEYFNNLKKLPEVSVEKNGIGYNLMDKKCHEAAYDAYLTGLIFLAVSGTLGDLKIFENLPDSAFIKPILNKLNIRKIYDIPYMNIGGNDVEPDRSGVYHLTFPKEWRKENISELFKSCGYINISWINSTSAFIKVNDECKEEIKKILLSTNDNYKLCTYDKFRNGNCNEFDLLLSPLLEKMLGKEESSGIHIKDTPLERNVKVIPKKRQIEDIGEVISRPEKKKC